MMLTDMVTALTPEGQRLNPHIPLVQLLRDKSQQKCFPSSGKKGSESAWKQEPEVQYQPSMVNQPQPLQQKS